MKQVDETAGVNINTSFQIYKKCHFVGLECFSIFQLVVLV